MFQSNKICHWRRVRSFFWPILLGAIFAHPVAASQGKLVVRDDPGGSVEQQVAAVRDLQTNGTRVEIRGDFCMSACTMYLALTDVCTTPRTIFGFHGPGSEIYGIGLPPAAFEHWSRVIARHYPEPIRSWYLNVARNRTIGFYSVRGRDLIEMGVAAC